MEFLRKITKQYKEKNLYSTEVQEIAEEILASYMDCCIYYATKGEEEAPIYSFTIDMLYKNIRIESLVPAIIEFLKPRIKMELFYREFIVNKTGQIYIEVTQPSALDLTLLSKHEGKDSFLQVCFIYASWKNEEEK